jgi:hypothetical protein
MTKKTRNSLSAARSDNAFGQLCTLQGWYKRQGNASDRTVRFGKPVSVQDVKAAEKELKIPLPPAYVRFVTTHGTFKITVDGYVTALLSPKEIVRHTRSLRKEFADSDPDTEEIVADAIPVIGDPVRERYWLFIPSSQKPDHDMATTYFNCDDLCLNDRWDESEEFVGFEDLVKEVVAEKMKE